MDGAPGIKILLVEDSDSDATFMLHTLEQSSLPGNVYRVPTGEEALALLNEEPVNGNPRPDLIVLDLKLPGLDGFDVLKRIKTHEELKTIPVLIVTSSALEEDIHRAMNLQADLYLSKPFDLEGYAELVIEIEDFWQKNAAAE